MKRIERWKLLAMLTMALLFAVTMNLRGHFAGGDGTAADPWQIAAPEHLNNVRNYIGEGHSDKHFLQTADINLGTFPWTVGNGWRSIGRRNTPFYGTYDGNGYSINNLTMRRDQYVYAAGLFAYVEEGSLLNISLRDVDISVEGSFVGGLTGSLNNSIVINCYVTGTIITGYAAGGLIGRAVNSLIEQSSTDVNIIGHGSSGGLVGVTRDNTLINNSFSRGFVNVENHETGGLVGYHSYSEINNSYSSCLILGGERVGGLVGESRSSLISNSYSTGPVKGSWSVGGLTGRNIDTKITNCYSTSPVTGISLTGGLIGSNRECSTVLNSCWNKKTSGEKTSPAGIGKSTTAMLKQETFEAWDFVSIWKIDENRSFPYHLHQVRAESHNRVQPYNLSVRQTDGEVYLSWQYFAADDLQEFNIYRDRELIAVVNYPWYYDHDVTEFEEYQYTVSAAYPEGESPMSNILTVTVHPGFAAGKGTADSPYIIETAEQLDNIRYNKYAQFQQTKDIDLADYVRNNESGWMPIGCNDNPFHGTYDGGGHAISNLFIMNPAGREQGLFGRTHNAKLINVNLTNVDITALMYAGALVGHAIQTVITACYSNGITWAAHFSAGGLAGAAHDSTIIAGCRTEGRVGMGTRPEKKNSSIDKNPNKTVNRQPGIDVAKPSTNWLVSNDEQEALIISEKTSKSDRQPSSRGNRGHFWGTGGIVGNNSYNSLVIYSSSSALITGMRDVGGLAGSNGRGSRIVDSYSTGNVEGTGHVGGLAGVNEGYIINSYSTGKVTGEINTGGLTAWSNRQNIEASYWDIDTSGQTSSGGGEGRTTAQMTYPYKDTFTGWDFENVWAADVDYELNNGYPYILEAVLSVEDEHVLPRRNFTLKNYPNPFNPDTIIQFTLPQDSKVILTVFNIKGQTVRKLVNQSKQAGKHRIIWNGHDDSGRKAASGVYFYRLMTDNHDEVRKMLMLK